MPWLPDPITVTIEDGRWIDDPSYDEAGGGVLARVESYSSGWRGYQHVIGWYPDDHPGPTGSTSDPPAEVAIPVASLIDGIPDRTGRVRLELEYDIVARDLSAGWFQPERPDSDDVGTERDGYLSYPPDGAEAVTYTPVVFTHWRWYEWAGEIQWAFTEDVPGNDIAGHVLARLSPGTLEQEAHAAPESFYFTGSTHGAFIETSGHRLHIYVEVSKLPPPPVEPDPSRRMYAGGAPPARRSVDFLRNSRSGGGGGGPLNQRRVTRRIRGTPAEAVAWARRVTPPPPPPPPPSEHVVVAINQFAPPFVVLGGFDPDTGYAGHYAASFGVRTFEVRDIGGDTENPSQYVDKGSIVRVDWDWRLDDPALAEWGYWRDGGFGPVTQDFNDPRWALAWDTPEGRVLDGFPPTGPGVGGTASGGILAKVWWGPVDGIPIADDPSTRVLMQGDYTVNPLGSGSFVVPDADVISIAWQVQLPSDVAAVQQVPSVNRPADRLPLVSYDLRP